MGLSTFFSTSDFRLIVALLVVFIAGVLLGRAKFSANRKKAQQTVNQEYFKGLNFLLNEEPDKAIEVFIKALEVDSDTVELHLALGGLFRRKGEVDRATRIHQNLIARTNLTEQQRLQAIYELAQDYYKAGLLDRAESLFDELKQTAGFRRQAIEGLSAIYQKQKDWKKAIDVTDLHRRGRRGDYARECAHFWCELAQQAIKQQAFEEAGQYLRAALKEDNSVVRAVFLRGENKFRQGDYAKAKSIWQDMVDKSPQLAELVVDKIITCYQKLQNQTGLEDYLLQFEFVPSSAKRFAKWQQALLDCLGESKAQQLIFEKISRYGISNAAASYLSENNQQQSLSSEQRQQLINDLLKRSPDNNVDYMCSSCGFKVKAHYWHCPNCAQWDSFHSLVVPLKS